MTRRILLVFLVALLGTSTAQGARPVEIAPVRTLMAKDVVRANLVAAGASSAATILVAQWALETESGRKMWNYNYAGIKGTSPRGYFVRLKTSERLKNGRYITIRARFRSYRTARMGADDFLQVLRTRFPKALKHAKAGNHTRYVYALHAARYFTEDPKRYLKALEAHL